MHWLEQGEAVGWFPTTAGCPLAYLPLYVCGQKSTVSDPHSPVTLFQPRVHTRTGGLSMSV